MLTLLCLFAAEMLIYTKALWPFRLVAAWVLAPANLAVAFALVGTEPSFYTWLIGVLTIPRMFNHMRIIKGRVKPEHLRRSARSVTVYVGALQMAALAAAAISLSFFTGAQGFVWLSVVQAAVAILLFAITRRNLRSSHFTPTKQYFADRELPSLTVAVPARNETVDMEDCLRSIVASDYPKLEVVALDDSSQDRTPEIIRQFAHDGVRFIQGVEPDEHWLAKNLAYERLYQEASGELVLFCGVDVRFQPESLKRIVTAMLVREKQMVSIMPQRFTDSVAGSFIQPMRYWWELALPRRQFDRPPVLSTCWAIRRDALAKLGGFASVSHNIIPEQYFARELIKTDAYSFLRSDAYMGIETQKSPAKQRQTAIRVLYPQLHRRPELAFAISVLELALFLAPFALVPYGLLAAQYLVSFTAGVAAAFLIATHVSIVAVSSPPSIAIALVNYPFAVLAELALGFTSMYKYEFSSVVWKGRTITPVASHLEAIPRLPTLE